MSSSPCQWTTLRPFVFSGLMVSCFVTLFFTYSNFEMKFPSFNIFVDRAHQSCPPVQCAAADSNCSTELQHNHTQEIQVEAVDTEPDTIVLIWMWPFGVDFELSCSKFHIKKCQLTDDKALYDKAHAVLFHHRDIYGNLDNMPKEPRPWFQKWVWFNMESPANSGLIPELDDLFNLTSTYRLDSNIPVPYGHLEPVKPEDERFKLPVKDKLVCWIVSNWSPEYRRVQFYNEMKNHIEIHIYGNAFGNRITYEDYTSIVTSCKFYLAFENSLYHDYLSDKIYSPMKLGTVPVVLGPSRQNYEDHVPGDSFIHVDDFSTPKELADRLLYLDKNETEYTAYFDWTNRFKVQQSTFGPTHACETCRYLQRNKGYQAFHGLNKWYWG
ncbi:4-galactosyl-N-acetylglucosaminide 3-alpha-L-fucosyltransferase 9-like [Acanthopagrus latus]|uniref:4-galactosyl-N-acetylglucosaminide 3-alpha-L-fucosyltransferase 9-like n=1 Tax=Acanthopagrus latus TaxID=8177 RepID=UPI00187C425E|nr:4-galactosyl-N-acetylglucosaminide 3-alpha-L-fucosyltransferase 9-like [Acanthopagrus latus]